MEVFVIPVLIVSAIGVLSGVILAVASKVMAVPVDERFTLVREELPGANCGACGYAGCDAYAQAMVDDSTVAINLCTPGGASVAAKLGEVLGVAAGEVEAKYALVHCSGTCDKTSYAIDYEGPQTCAACNTFFGGRGTCPSACMGFGDCVSVCQYDAIHVIDGVAVVDPEACVACGLCVKACPKLLIDIVPKSSNVYVSCSNTQKGGVTRKACTVGCIGCMRCTKVCPTGAITVSNNLATIDPATCTNCGACVEVCPTKCIRTVFEMESQSQPA